MSRKATVIEIDPLINDYQNEIENFNNDVGSGKHIFLFLFMDGCGPCNQTKPQWKKIQKMLKNSHGNREHVVIAAINQKLFENLKSFRVYNIIYKFRHITSVNKRIFNSYKIF
jgi:thiol-disulfide isomerase/thioredoxin